MGIYGVYKVYKMVERQEKVEKVAWNLSEAINYEISLLIQQARHNFQSGYLDKWFFTLQSMKKLIRPKLSKEERNELMQKEYIIGKNILHRSKYGYFIDQYHEAIFDFLKKYGFYPRDMEDKTKINY